MDKYSCPDCWALFSHHFINPNKEKTIKALTVKEEIKKRCKEDPEFKKEYEERVRLKSEFKKAAEPLIKYLQNNWHPHVKVIVDCESAELLEGEMIQKYEIEVD